MKKMKAAKMIMQAATPLVKKDAEAAADRRNASQNRHTELLEQLNEKIEKQLSWKENIKLGLIKGAATAIGATVVAGIALWIFGAVVNTVDDVPVIRDAVEQINLESSTGN